MDRQIGKLIARVAENLPDMDGVVMQEWIDNPKGLQLFLSGLNPKPKSTLLDFISTINITATTERFVARDKFKLKKDGGLCSYFGDNFRRWFLGKIEDPIGEQTLRFAKLRRQSVDGPIITELGGEAKAETTLTEVWYLMSLQPNGEAGVLITNGWANIFYVPDSAGVLRAVGVYWLGRGWIVNAFEVSNPDSWDEGDRVFSRNPSVPQEPAVS